MCGLKQGCRSCRYLRHRSHPSWVCGLKPYYLHHENINLSHTLRGCVDWNIGICEEHQRTHSHTLRGCVDWNKLLEKLMPLIWVTPFVGVWIETKDNLKLWGSMPVTPFVGVWIETCQDPLANTGSAVTPFVGVWIETLTHLALGAWVLVTPFVGVWIETSTLRGEGTDKIVTPFVGVWIETYWKLQHHSVV